MTIVNWRDGDFERRLLEEISLEVPWDLIEEFASLHRLSGSDDERNAVTRITSRLEQWGVPHSTYWPTCLISIPVEASVRLVSPEAHTFCAKTQSFSPSTGGEEVFGELVYVPSAQASDFSNLFGASGLQRYEDELRGKILLTEGLAMAVRGIDLEALGVIAAIFVNPGQRIHEGLASTVWGSPDLESPGDYPAAPVLAVNRVAGSRLIDAAKRGDAQVAFSTSVTTEWCEIPVVEARIDGNVVPDEFTLFHGHLDSWHVGVGDNATGNATLLELARVFWKHRHLLARSLRIAWWSGHSHGHYAGSTWYAEEFAIDLAENCISHINCDSPGCRGATAFENVMWMAEAEELSRGAIKDVTGLDATGMRPLRVGDVSFNNIGIPMYFMLSSTIPSNELARLGYYAVGGCGGNIEWHTEADTIDVVNKTILLRDINVYAAVLARTLNAPIVPFDYRKVVDELLQTVKAYEGVAGLQVDFSKALAEIDQLRQGVNSFYQRVEADNPEDPRVGRSANGVQRELARCLVSLYYSRAGRFRQDRVHPVPPVPELSPALQLRELDPQSHSAHVNRTDLRRGINRLIWQCRQARRSVEAFLAS